MKALVSSVALALLLSACGRDSDCGSADCSAAILKDGITFTERGFTDHGAERAGRAAASKCEDTCGPDSRGAYFPDDAKQIRVWSFPDQDPAEVLGLRISDGRFRILVANGVESGPILKALKAT